MNAEMFVDKNNAEQQKPSQASRDSLAHLAWPPERLESNSSATSGDNHSHKQALSSEDPTGASKKFKSSNEALDDLSIQLAEQILKSVSTNAKAGAEWQNNAVDLVAPPKTKEEHLLESSVDVKVGSVSGLGSSADTATLTDQESLQNTLRNALGTDFFAMVLGQKNPSDHAEYTLRANNKEIQLKMDVSLDSVNAVKS